MQHRATRFTCCRKANRTNASLNRDAKPRAQHRAPRTMLRRQPYPLWKEPLIWAFKIAIGTERHTLDVKAGRHRSPACRACTLRR